MTELTEAEIERLRDWYENETPDWGLPTLLPVVAAIIDARLAPIRALAEEWADADGEPVSMDGLTALSVTNRLGRTLLAALSAHESAPQAAGGTGGHPDDERAGEGAQRVHNHPPYRPLCPERCIDGQLRGACLNDDGSPR